MSRINKTTRSIQYVAHWTPYDRASHGNGYTHYFQDRAEFEDFRASKGSRCTNWGRWVYHVRVSFKQTENGFQVDHWAYDYGINHDGSVSETPYGCWNDHHESFESFSKI